MDQIFSSWQRAAIEMTGRSSPAFLSDRFVCMPTISGARIVIAADDRPKRCWSVSVDYRIGGAAQASSSTFQAEQISKRNLVDHAS